jgi:cellulose synthase/poly-beta-1,6-N-acetylglucosamine synthase-like glycosyltransferase/peptidoglycan/xylan/chitin deacetylase (PgdA/CDA1 family)
MAADAAEPRPSLRPVFVEPTGRRWRVLRLVAVVVLATLGVVAARQLAPVADLLRQPLPGTAPEAVVQRLLGHHRGEPVAIGSGPLVRLAAVHDARLSDPFTGAFLGTLSPTQRTLVGSAPVVVQRYGYAPGGHHLVLTFDDGPDPAWTPHLLDILARHHVRATFFVTGRASAAHPDLVRRIVREGHALGNHSLTHRDLSAIPDWRARLEIAGNERLLEALTRSRAGYVRPPYDGGQDAVLADEALAIARAQRLGYPVASYDDDTHDWVYGGGSGDGQVLVGTLPPQIPLPRLDGRNITLLMHDAGGDRSRTLDYVDRRLVPAAQAAGYTFDTFPEAAPALAAGTGPSGPPTRQDRAMAQLAQVWLVLPNEIVGALFVLGVVTVGATSLAYTALALVRRRRRRPPPLRRDGHPGEPLPVTVLIAAYNEEPVIEATLRSLVRSRYPVREFLVVDDGSTDATAEIVERLRTTLDPRIRLLRQPNGRKPAALNCGMRAAVGDYVVTVDADTHADPDLVGNLVRHFEADPYGTLAAVAGVVRVGNRGTNLLTRWQGLEYLSLIGIERAAHDLLGAIAIVPGACAGWRRAAVLQAGGFSDATLAEDNDLTLSLHRLGWRITQDDEARASTEAPEDLDSLLRQCVRWTFGSVQATTKHRDMLLRPRYGWLGMFVLPSGVMSLVLPLLSIPLVAVMSVLVVTQQGPLALGGYYLLFTAVQGLVAAAAVRMLREDKGHLLVVPVYRFVYEPLRAYLLYRSAYLAARGAPVGWNKLARTGALNRVPLPRSGERPGERSGERPGEASRDGFAGASPSGVALIAPPRRGSAS